MNTLAIQGIGFGSSHSNISNRPTDKPSKNEPTVTMPRSKYEELRRNAAKGVMAMTMAAAVMGGGTAVTSCSSSDDVPEINTQTDKIDVQGQATLMNMLQTVGVPIVTNSTNPKYVKNFTVSALSTDFDVSGNNENNEGLKGNWTYDDQLSTKDKSVYNSTDSKQLVVTKENFERGHSGEEYQLKGVITQPGAAPITIDLGQKTEYGEDGLHFIRNNDDMGSVTRSDKGTGWVYCSGADIEGNIQIRAMAK